jgi:hypothetical protein
MKKIRWVALPALVAAALKRLRTRARDLLKVDGYRPEKHFMRGPGPRTRAKAGRKPELPAQ